MGSDGHISEEEANQLFARALNKGGVHRVEAHVDQCPDCRRLLGALARTFTRRLDRHRPRWPPPSGAR